MVLSGYSLVFRLGLHAAADCALAGGPVVYLDWASTSDPFVIGRRTWNTPGRDRKTSDQGITVQKMMGMGVVKAMQNLG